MTDRTKQEVKPTFPGLVELVRAQYARGFGVEIGYAKGASLVDEAIQPLINSQVLAVLEELEGKAVVLTFDSNLVGNDHRVAAVPLSAIQTLKEKYKPSEEVSK